MSIVDYPQFIREIGDKELRLFRLALEQRAEFFEGEAVKLDTYVPVEHDFIANPAVVAMMFREQAKESLDLAQRVTVWLGEDEDEDG